MAMRKFHDLKSAKEIYIERVLYHIHYGKLKKRIKAEIENHMDDMYDDFKNDFEFEIDAVNKVVDEMGDPDKLGLELKEANKRILLFARLFKIAIGICAIPLSFFILVLISNIHGELTTYFHATDIETKEMQIVEKYNDGEPIRLLAEIEYDGIVYRYYFPDEQPENKFVLFKTQSVKVFGISFRDKFLEYGRSSGPDVNELSLTIGDARYNYDDLWVLYGETGPKYIKRYYEPIDEESGLEPYWSDFIEVPQSGTYENPVIIYSQSPEGYKWNTFQRYDENKEIYVYPKDDNKLNYYSSESIQ